MARFRYSFIPEEYFLCCGFSFKEEDLEIYKQKLEQRRQHNAEINRKSTKLHLIWFAIFTIVILLASWLTGE